MSVLTDLKAAVAARDAAVAKRSALIAALAADAPPVVVDPPPVVTPPPIIVPPPVIIPPGVRRVRPNLSATWDSPDQYTGAKWTLPGGDWFDANGDLNGPVPCVSYKVQPGTLQTVDVSKIDGDIIVNGMTFYWDNPMLDGVPAVNPFWLAPGAPSQPLPFRYGRPAFIPNAGRAKTLTFTINGTADVGRTIRLDKVAGPAVVYPPMVNPRTRKPNIIDLDITSRAAVTALMAPSGDYQPGYTRDSIAFNEQYLVCPETGVHFIRFTNASDFDPRFISWFLRFPPRDVAFCGFAFRIGADAADGMTAQGCKLCGFGCDVPGKTISYTAEHNRVSLSPDNRGLYGFETYRYDVQVQQKMDQFMGVTLEAEKWYYPEMGWWMNDPGKANGRLEMRLNGATIWELNNYAMRDDASQKISHFHGQVFAGGTGHGKATYHYDQALYYVDSDGFIGTPPQFAKLTA